MQGAGCKVLGAGNGVRGGGGGYGGRGELDDAPERLEEPGRESRRVPAFLFRPIISAHLFWIGS